MKLTALLIASLSWTLGAQELNPTQRQVAPDSEVTPIYKVNVVARTTKAVNYGYLSAPTRVDFAGTVLLPESKGQARIDSRKGAVQVRAEIRNLYPPSRFGTQYLTYVLWAITPEGRATSLGEILTNADDDGRIETATELQSFALIVTAEPYYAVTQPSDVVVMENVVRADTAGRVQAVDAKYELLSRGQYTYDVNKAKRADLGSNAPKVSQAEYEALLALYQARNAVQLAKADGAAEYSRETFDKSQAALAQAERYYSESPKSKLVVTLAREATQMAEDSRLISLRKKKGGETARQAALN